MVSSSLTCGRLNTKRHWIEISDLSTWKSLESKFMKFLAVKVKAYYCLIVLSRHFYDYFKQAGRRP